METLISQIEDLESQVLQKAKKIGKDDTDYKFFLSYVFSFKELVDRLKIRELDVIKGKQIFQSLLIKLANHEELK